MKKTTPEYKAVHGKTYSLFGNSDSTSEYFDTVRMLADKIQLLEDNTSLLIEKISLFSNKKRLLEKTLKNGKSDELMPLVLNLIDPYLRKFTESAVEHLKSLSVSKLWDRRLATSREQYHLYMLEIELTNRLFSVQFTRADKKIALMPYCLQDFSVSCKSAKNGFDYKCRHCSMGCYQNHASKILDDNNIEPYIWMEGDMKGLAKYTLGGNRTFGVLGIACIPELVSGMRNCRKNNIPVVGIPLNANRCRRWFGEFYPNSIDLRELDKLVTLSSLPDRHTDIQ